jgi:hypothetical protein
MSDTQPAQEIQNTEEETIPKVEVNEEDTASPQKPTQDEAQPEDPKKADEVEKPKPQEPEDKPLKEMMISEVLKVNCQTVDFGDVMPGQIIEETIIILNNMSKTKVPFKVKVNCLSDEFEDLDEYVYSMRRPTPNEVFNYNDTFLIILAQKAISYYKLAIKVPNVLEDTKVLGNIEITSEDTKDSLIEVPILANVVMPKLKCEKMMRIKSLDMSVVKLFMKNPVRQDFRIAFKNCGNQVCFVEFSVQKNERLVNFLDFNFYPAQIGLQPFISNNFVMSIKTKGGIKNLQNNEVRFLLIAKVKNSSAIFAYPVFLTLGGVKMN